MKSLCRHLFNIFMFNMGVFFSNVTLLLVYGEQLIVSATAISLTPLINKSIRCELRTCTGNFIGWQVMASWDSISPIFVWFCLDHLHRCVYFMMFLTYYFIFYPSSVTWLQPPLPGSPHTSPHYLSTWYSHSSSPLPPILIYFIPFTKEIFWF